MKNVGKDWMTGTVHADQVLTEQLRGLCGTGGSAPACPKPQVIDCYTQGA